MKAIIDGIKYELNSDTKSATIISPSTISRNPILFDTSNSKYEGEVNIPSCFIHNSVEYSVTGIGEYAFYDCSSLTSITIPNSVTSIGEYTFFGCSSLTSITIPNSVRSIGHYAFCACSSLASITIPNSVRSIGHYAFCACSSLTSISIPNSIGSIEDRTFAGCSSLATIIIPNSIRSIGVDTFSGCSSLTSIIVESGNMKYDSRNNCNAIIETATNTLIAGCKNTRIPNSATSIGDYAFSGYSSLINITIPNSVTSIGDRAFADCSSLTSITIPISVISIEKSAFNGCSSLTSIIVESGNMKYDSRNNCNAIIETATNTLIAGCKNTRIPNSATSIGDYAFSGYSSLINITIPNSVTSIGDHAFAGCSSLKSIIIPDSVRSIGDNAFRDCSSLTSITIPSSVTNIRYMAFYSCDSLTSITIPDSVTSIGKYAFSYCSSLTSITIPNSITSIGGDTFAGCSSLKSIIVEDDNTKYDSRDNCNAIIETATNTLITGCKNTIIPNSVTSIGDDAFAGCSSLIHITIPDSVTNIGDEAFKGCSSLTSITIPSSVTRAGWNAFSGCSSLTSIVWNARKLEERCTNNVGSQITSFIFGDSVEHIPEDLCRGMNNLTSITIPDSVTSIGKYAFYGCSSLTSITIPNSVRSIGDDAFKGCSSLTSVVWNAKKLENRCNQPFNDIESLITSFIFGDSVEHIPEDLCYGMNNLTSITLPDSVTSIGDYAFYGCSLLTSITIPDSVIFIGDYAFKGCSSLTSITIPDSVRSIEECVFCGCSSLRSIIIPNSIRRIEDKALSGCSSLRSITIPNGVKSIGDDAFAGCSSLTSITIPNSVRSIEDNALSGCSSLTSIIVESSNMIYDSRYNCNALIKTDTNTLIAGCQNTIIPNCVTSIGNHAFSGRSSLRSITIPDGVTSIGDDAFRDCSSLTSIVLPDSVISIGDDAFAGCSSLTSITIPNSVRSIEDNALSGCSSLTSIIVESSNMIYDSRDNCNALIHTDTNTLIAGCQNTIIPNSVTSIGKYAFYGCSSLTSITIPESVTNIGYGAFDYCSSLISVIWNARKYEKSYSWLGYPFDSSSSITSFIFGDSIEHIPAGFCSNMHKLTAISISDSVTSIGRDAFYGCISLTVITLKASSIENFCESNINMLLYSVQCLTKRHLLINGIDTEELAVPESVTILKDYAFYGCSNIVTITLPETLNQIGEHIFDDCESLQTIRIPMNKKEEYCKLGLEPYRQYIEEIKEIVPEELQQEMNILLNIARGYELGIGMVKNLPQAVLTYSQAAEKGCAEAAYHLGELYEKGEGLPQDYQCAIDWYTKAVSLYHPSAEERKKHCEQILQKEVYVAECQFDIQKSKQTAKYIFFDTECNGLPFSNKLGVDDTSNWPRMIQLAWLVTDEHGNILKRQSHIIYPQGFIITNEVENLTGITTSRAKSEGVNLRTVLNEFMDDLVDAELVIGHNIDFDKHVLGCELYREGLDYDELFNKESVCTMQRSTNFCAIPNPNSYYGGYKWPKLEELHRKLFGCNIFGAHDALTDVEATKKCFYELKKKGIL